MPTRTVWVDLKNEPVVTMKDYCGDCFRAREGGCDSCIAAKMLLATCLAPSALR
jgi:hypothetical protein